MYDCNHLHTPGSANHFICGLREESMYSWLGAASTVPEVMNVVAPTNFPARYYLIARWIDVCAFNFNYLRYRGSDTPQSHLLLGGVW